jgi:hypothetical protein
MAALSLVVALAACSDDAPSPIQTGLAPTGSPSYAKGPTDVAVTTTIADADPSIAASFQIRSDGRGTYTNSTLTSQILSNGKWLLDSYFAHSTRTMYLDFSRPVPGSGPNGGDAVAIPSGTYVFQSFVDCPNSFYNNSFFTIAPGQTVHCPFHIGELYVGSDLYSVNMNPYTGAEGFAWTETNWANVTCTSAAAPCSAWSITPSATAPDGSTANVAVLLKHVTTTTKGHSTTTPVKQGDFYMSFRIDVTKP